MEGNRRWKQWRETGGKQKRGTEEGNSAGKGKQRRETEERVEK